MALPELKEFVPTNPLDAAANALDPIAFLGNWPNRKNKARLAVVKVLTELRDIENGWGYSGAWADIVDDILRHDPGGR